MIRTKRRMAVCIILLSLNVAFIWINSLLPSRISAAFSKLISYILNFLFPGPDIPSSGEGHGILRKIAHVTEFCCLGVLLCWLIGMLRVKKWELCTWSLLAGLLVASIDETIQCFVPGRGPAIRDVLIDCCGVMLGILIMLGIQHIRKKKSS